MVMVAFAFELSLVLAASLELPFALSVVEFLAWTAGLMLEPAVPGTAVVSPR